MSDINIFKPIIDRISDFFHIFDTSYFITGFFGTISIIFMLYINVDISENAFLKSFSILTLIKEANFTMLVLLCIISYVNGLIFAIIGRVIRKDIYENMFHRFKYLEYSPIRYFNFKTSIDLLIFELIIIYRLKDSFLNFIGPNENHKLKIKSENQSPISIKELFDKYNFETHNFINYYLHTSNSYINNQRVFYKYYIYIWSVIRDQPKYKASYTHLARKWVICTKYDGMSTILIINSLLLFFLNYNDLNWGIIITSLLLLLCSWWFIREARDTYKFMIQDLLSTYSINK